MTYAAQMKTYDVIIIGAGAAGLMCAIEAGKRGRKTLLIDHAPTIGEKIRISGGGRCNFTNLNASPANFLSQNPYFCVSALKRYTQHDFIKLVEANFIKYHEKTLGQLFCDGSATQIIEMLKNECDEAGVEIMLNTAVKTPLPQGGEILTSPLPKGGDGGGFSLAQEQVRTLLPTSSLREEELRCASLVIATGGPSIPKMGASAFGYKVAEQFGLQMVPPRAALVPFTLYPKQLEELKELVGVSMNVVASCNGTSFAEGMLFTHRGLSGPAILQISSYWKDGDSVNINFLPNIDVFETLKSKRQTKQELQTILSEFLPKKLARYLSGGFSGAMADMSNNILQDITNKLTNWQIKPSGTEGYRTAEVTIGGVDTNELSSKTFEAKKVPGLYFIGEVVDVTGWLGGYNFQWAWSSGHACGQFV